MQAVWPGAIWVWQVPICPTSFLNPILWLVLCSTQGSASAPCQLVVPLHCWALRGARGEWRKVRVLQGAEVLLPSLWRMEGLLFFKQMCYFFNNNKIGFVFTRVPLTFLSSPPHPRTPQSCGSGRRAPRQPFVAAPRGGSALLRKCARGGGRALLRKCAGGGGRSHPSTSGAAGGGGRGAPWWRRRWVRPGPVGRGVPVEAGLSASGERRAEGWRWQRERSGPDWAPVLRTERGRSEGQKRPGRDVSAPRSGRFEPWESGGGFGGACSEVRSDGTRRVFLRGAAGPRPRTGLGAVCPPCSQPRCRPGPVPSAAAGRVAAPLTSSPSLWETARNHSACKGPVEICWSDPKKLSVC